MKAMTTGRHEALAPVLPVGVLFVLVFMLAQLGHWRDHRHGN